MQLDTKQRVTDLLSTDLLARKQLVTKPPVVEHLAVADNIRDLLPDSGLVRGRIVRCSGDAGLSLVWLLNLKLVLKNWVPITG